MKKGNKGENGGKPKIAKTLDISTKPGPDVGSNKGPVISDPLRNIPVVPDLSVNNSANNNGRRKAGMIGINQPLSAEPIRKKRVLEDDEIEVDYDSPEDPEEKEGEDEIEKIFGQPDFEKVADNTSQNSQEVENEQDKEVDKLAGEIFGENESSTDTIVSDPNVPIVSTPDPKRAKVEYPKPKTLSYGENQKKKRKDSFFEKINFFNTWKKERADVLRTSRRTVYDFLPQFEASRKGKVRLAMLLSLPLNSLPHMSYKDRLWAWTDNIVDYFNN